MAKWATDSYIHPSAVDEDAQCGDCVWFESDYHNTDGLSGDYCHRLEEFINRLCTCNLFANWDGESERPWKKVDACQ